MIYMIQLIRCVIIAPMLANMMSCTFHSIYLFSFSLFLHFIYTGFLTLGSQILMSPSCAVAKSWPLTLFHLTWEAPTNNIQNIW